MHTRPKVSGLTGEIRRLKPSTLRKYSKVRKERKLRRGSTTVVGSTLGEKIWTAESMSRHTGECIREIRSGPSDLAQIAKAIGSAGVVQTLTAHAHRGTSHFSFSGFGEHRA
jgi:hypothetical protein